MHRTTVDIYERQAGVYAADRPARWLDRARAFAGCCLPGRPVVDLGCGPGGYLDALGPRAVALDAAEAMLALVGERAPRVLADLEALPFRDRSLGGGWARNSYLHLAKAAMPLALARLQWALAVGAPIEISVATGDDERVEDDSHIPGRLFAAWDPHHLRDVLVGAGFDEIVLEAPENDTWARARRARTLPDTVGPGMRLLVCGLNPSVVAADAGVGFAGATNRFWPAAVEAGLVTRGRDPLHALVAHGVGMTDLVKRATPNAAVLTTAEYRSGLERVSRLVAWLRPASILFVGLAGWRAAADPKAQPGWQPAGLAGAPVYVMPSTSGLNARTTRAELVEHLRLAACPAS